MSKPKNKPLNRVLIERVGVCDILFDRDEDRFVVQGAETKSFRTLPTARKHATRQGGDNPPLNVPVIVQGWREPSTPATLIGTWYGTHRVRYPDGREAVICSRVLRGGVAAARKLERLQKTAADTEAAYRAAQKAVRDFSDENKLPAAFGDIYALSRPVRHPARGSK